MKGWIENCQDSHQLCEMPQQVGGPKRLLQCLSDGSVRLVETQSRPQRCGYIALSYCWGDGKAVPKTTEKGPNKTLNLHQRGIPGESLPRLFQEAVALARGLNIPYIWIDSLCIIQDSDKEKEEELMKMSDIFCDALVVVVAASAQSPLSSLLRDKPQSDQGHTWRTASLIGYQGMDLDVKFRKRAWRAHFSPEITDRTPIGKRAWCFQEKLLASRCLVFGDDEVVWECRSCCLCECAGEQEHFSVGKEFTSGSAPTMRPYIQWKPPSTEHGPFQIDGMDTHSVYAFWESAVYHYSARALSFKTDRLPAISAVASIFAKVTRDCYLAGLWRNELLVGLSWHASWFTNVGLKDDRRPHQEYIAPTWSWASLPRGVSYSHFLRWHRTQDSRDADLDAAVLDAWTTLEGQNPYGRVSDGAIVLSGLHCDAELTIPERESDDAQLDFGDDDVQTLRLGVRPFLALDLMPVEPDPNVDRLGGNSRHLRRITDRETDGQPACSGTVRLLWLEKDISLILTPSRRREGAYERLGIFCKDAYGEPVNFVPKMSKKAQRSRITLV